MKNIKTLRIIALILCAAMLMTVLGACAKKPAEEDTDTVDDEETEEEETPNDFQTIYEYFPVDKPVLKIGDVDINWGLFYFTFYQEVTQLNTTNTVLDWTAEYSSTGMTYLEYAASEAIYDYLRRYAGIEHFSREYGVELTPEQEAQYEADRASDVELFEGEEAMLDYMNTKFLDDSVAEYMARSEYLYDNLMDYVVGENGEKIEAEDILKMANTAYKMIKVIPFPISDENGNPVSKDEKDAQLASAQEALDQLKGLTGDALSQKFDELIDQYADSDKAEELKGGYVFNRGKFDTGLEKTLTNIPEGGIADQVIEGADNYYVVLRLPVDIEKTPYSTANGFGEETLRQMYKDEVFSDIFWDWADNAPVEFYPELEEFDIYQVLGWYA